MERVGGAGTAAAAERGQRDVAAVRKARRQLAAAASAGDIWQTRLDNARQEGASDRFVGR